MMHKLNVKVILILVLIAITLGAANFYIGQEKEKLRRIKLEEMLKLTVAEVDNKIEESIEREVKEKEALRQELQKEKEWSLSLEKQIKDKDTQIQLALTKIEDKDRINSETIERLREEEKQNAQLGLDLRQMQTEIALIKKENEELKQPQKK